MRSAAFVFLVIYTARSACIAVPGDRIRAQDLSRAVPLFQSAPPEEVIGFAPFPGVTRVLTSREMLLAARRFGLQTTSGEAMPSVCIERVVHPLSPEEVRNALLAALHCEPFTCDVARLEILEFSNQPLPPGRLSFPLAALNRPPADVPESAVIWSGQLIYDLRRSLSVWAKVRITVNREVIVARESIPKTSIIHAGQITTTRMSMFPLPEPLPPNPAGVIGKVARREIHTGERIVAQALEDGQDVIRGETVSVVVLTGGASISLAAVAASSGNKGETVLIRNPSTGKIFRAKIEDRKRVLVHATAGSDL